ncbi:MAG TPA: AMP-binding protein, partial [Terriglobia bacterium]|nr:AMP-binding protein [Terriglobia bacterium]
CHPVALSSAVTEALKRLCANEDVTPFMMLLAAFKTLLYRQTGEEDVIVGSPVSNRSRAELEDMIGLFVNTLAIRTSLQGQPSFRELLARVRDVVLSAYSHQDLPFEMLVDALGVERRADSTPVFQVMFAYQNMPRIDWGLPGVRVEARNIDTGTAKFDVTLFMWETTEGFGGLLEYDADLFDAPAMSQFVERFGRLLEEVAVRPDQSIATLPLLSSAETYWLIDERNDTSIDYPRDTTIHEEFEAQARLAPDAIALVFGSREITYSELDRDATQLAADLVKAGVRPGMLVEIPAESEPSVIVQMLAILKCGAAFVPQPGLVKPNWRFPASASRPLAYVMFTSGSTGTPKGVCISHRAVLRLVKGANYASLTSEDVFLQIAPVAFDASTFEIWGALLNGAKLVMLPNRRPSLKEISGAIVRHDVSVLFLTSALFELFLDTHLAELVTVRQLLVGGDVLSVTHTERFLERARSGQLIHCYGPTENTTFTTYHPLLRGQKFDGGTIPIGGPISNTQIYVLDELQQLVPAGVVGEAYVGGDGLMEGYLDDEELTRDRLIPNPFPDRVGTFVYRTGDLVRYRRDGNLEFIGRTDDQVKIRGFRVELGAVEVALGRCPLVKQVCVAARNKRLVAYVVVEPVEHKPSERISLIRGFAREKLPHHLVPSAFVFLETLPLKSNGKVDRSALPLPTEETGIDGNPPRGEMERLVANAFALVLGVERIGRDESFFDRGGDSLMALNLFAMLENTFNRDLPLVSLFEHQTVAQFAAFLRMLDSSEPACSPHPSASGPRLVEIKRGQSRMPFFLVPGGTGGTAELMIYAR